MATLTNSLTKKPQSNLEVIHNNLNGLLSSKMQALPKGFNQTRFVQNAMTVLLDTKGINDMNPVSVARTIAKGAFLDLDFFRKECYAIPYGKELNFQTDYKGDVKIAKKYSIRPIKDIYAKLVREGDVFQETVEYGIQNVIFRPLSFSNKPIIGAFAVCVYADGELIVETMTLEELETVRTKFSKCSNSGAWVNTTGEMYKKVTLRRLCKHIPLEFDSHEKEVVFSNSNSTSFEKDETEVNKLIFDDVIEAEANVIESKVKGSNSNANTLLDGVDE